MNHASLFSGIGGAEVAASWMGWHNAFHCEIEEFPRKVLQYWFPNSESYEDITKTDFTKWHGKVDVLTGGFPCQPFSLAGRRKGADDNRYLWPHMLRAIREVQPTWVVGENVAGIKTMVESCQVAKLGRSDDLFEENYLYREESRFTLDKICADLEAEGYSVQPIVIPACAIGAPHRRDRVWIVAHRSDPRAEVQQEGQDRPQPRSRRHGSGTTPSYAHGTRQRRRKNKQEPFTECSRTPNLGTRRKERLAAHSMLHRGDQVHQDLQPKEPDGAKPNGTRLQRTDAHSQCERLEGMHEPWGEEGKRQHIRRNAPRHNQENVWRNFPTVEPTVCRGNDGLPFDVDNLTISFSKWRQESIKAYGNAWVPQVAYEIFRAIEEISL